MKAKRKPSCILFDENSRKEFITGFHKRKLERRKKFQEKLERELKEAKKRIRDNARELTRKITNLHDEDHISPIFQKSYELPDHTVQVRELSTHNVVPGCTWTEENECRLPPESESEFDYDGEDRTNIVDESVPGMQLHSVKAMRKAVSKQSLALMRRDSVFKKKNRIERTKNKQDAKKKKMLGKNQRKKKGKRRK